MDVLPNEIWYIVFSNLDEKSLKCASLACKFWFELIRGNSNLSGHIILNPVYLSDFQRKVENSEWIWDRWSALKVIELHGNGPVSQDEAIDFVKKAKFAQCITLENVIFSVNIDLIDYFEDNSNIKVFLPTTGTVEKLSFNPKVNFKYFGLENIFHLKDVNFNEVQTNIENLKWNWETLHVLQTLELTIGDEIELLEDIKNTVKKIDFTQCPSLENIILNVNCDLGEFFKQEHPNLPTIGTVQKLKLNPKDSLKNLGLEHIFWLQVRFSQRNIETKFRSIVYDILASVGLKSNNITYLNINIQSSLTNVGNVTRGLGKLFKGLNGSLKTVFLNNRNVMAYGNAVLGSLSDNCPKIVNLLMDPYREEEDDPEAELPNLKNHFKYLRELHVPKFKHINCLLKDCDTLKELFFKCKSVDQLSHYDMTDFSQRFKNLRKCHIFVVPRTKEECDKCIEWQEALDEKVKPLVTVNVYQWGPSQYE